MYYELKRVSYRTAIIFWYNLIHCTETPQRVYNCHQKIHTLTILFDTYNGM